MGQDYRHFSLEERCEIARLQAEGRSLRQIAAAMDRAPSSIARELKRNRGSTVGYKPGYADERSKARRWTGSKLDRKPELRQRVLTHLSRGHSPEQTAGRIARETGSALISHETIYRFIYAQIARHQDYSWRLYLPRAKSKRGFRGHKGGSPANYIHNRAPISQRPTEVNDRKAPGHWEADLVLFAKYGQAILTLHERTSRILLAQRPANKTSALIADCLHSLFILMPPPMRQTVTFDNGSEFTQHSQLHGIDLKTFFCDTHSPWQKGGIENAIGRMRRFLPRKTDLATIPDEWFNALVAIYNHTPRKCLDFQTPAEVFCQQLLHFECESTPQLSLG
jgi:IS30 family transposase